MKLTAMILHRLLKNPLKVSLQFHKEKRVNQINIKQYCPYHLSLNLSGVLVAQQPYIKGVLVTQQPHLKSVLVVDHPYPRRLESQTRVMNSALL